MVHISVFCMALFAVYNLKNAISETKENVDIFRPRAELSGFRITGSRGDEVDHEMSTRLIKTYGEGSSERQLLI